MKLLRQESGQAILLWVLCLGVIMGFLAFAIDVGMLFRASRMAQAAADSAAIAGAAELLTTDYTAVAKAASAQNGVTNGVNGASVVVNVPPTSGEHSSSSSYIEVLVSQPVNTFFMSFVTGSSSVSVTARAVSGTGPGTNCIYALSTTGTNITLSNAGKLTSSSCGVVSDSSSSTAVSATGSAQINAKSTNIVGGYSIANNGSITPTPSTGIAAVPDPLAGMSPPSYTGGSSCTADPLTHYGNGGSSYSVGPGSTYSTTQGGDLVCYTSLTLGSNGDTVTINAGIYVITGALTFNSGTNLGGTGVMFYIVGSGSVNIGNGATVNLQAPSSGTYKGVLFYQDRSDTSTAQFEGGASSNVAGVLYFPDAPLTVGNGTTTNVSTPIIASTLTFIGGTNFTESQYANTPITTPKLVE